jgi:hypothetical protein
LLLLLVVLLSAAAVAALFWIKLRSSRLQQQQGKQQSQLEGGRAPSPSGYDPGLGPAGNGLSRAQQQQLVQSRRSVPAGLLGRSLDLWVGAAGCLLRVCCVGCIGSKACAGMLTALWCLGSNGACDSQRSSRSDAA